MNEKVKKWIVKAMEDYKTVENEFKLRRRNSNQLGLFSLPAIC